MEKTLNRKLTRWSKVFLLADAVYSIFAVFTGSSMVVFALIFAVLTAIGVVLMLTANRCPYCKTIFRGGSWFQPHAGYCNKCGKLMEYDDTVAEREAEREYRRQLREDE